MKTFISLTFLSLILAFLMFASTMALSSSEREEMGRNGGGSSLDNILSFFQNPDGSIDLVRASTSVTLLLLSIIFLTRSSWPKNGPPTYPYSIPWIGNAKEWGENPLHLLALGYKKFGEIFRIKILGQDMVFLVGSQAQQQFYETEESQFNAGQAYRFTVPVFGKGIVYDSSPEALIEQRKMVSNGLTIKRFKTYVGKIIKEVEDYLDVEWGESGELDIMEAFSQLTVLTSTRCLHGNEVRENLDKEFSQLYMDLDRGLSPIGFFFPNAPIPTHWKRDKARLRLQQLFDAIIQKREDTGERPDDMLQTLIEAKYEDGSCLTRQEVCGLMVALMLAGQHTSNVTSTWLGVHLLCEDEAMEGVMDELDSVWPKDEELDYGKLRGLKFLQNCVKETLRLQPPIIMVMRKVLKDWEYKGKIVPKGSLVCVSPAFSHRMEEYYSNPDKFDPDRFGPDRREDKKHKYTYLAFSAGKHACIGEQFAYVQIKTIWAILLRKYKLKLQVPKPSPDYKSLVVGPHAPVTVKYERRKD